MRACVRACVCVLISVNNLGQMEPVSRLKAASDKLKKPDNRSLKEVYNRYFNNSQRKAVVAGPAGRRAPGHFFWTSMLSTVSLFTRFGSFF